MSVLVPDERMFLVTFLLMHVYVNIICNRCNKKLSICRQELLRERERQKEEQVKALKYSMQSGMVMDFALFVAIGGDYNVHFR